MIEFSGRIDKKIKQFMIRRVFFGVLLIVILFFIVLGLPAISYLIHYNNFVPVLIVALSLIVSLIFTPLYLVFVYTPLKIKIDEEYIYGLFKESNVCRGIENVKKVIDHGYFYEIIFDIPNRHAFFLCQKDLLVQGTIEEFEQLFERLIVRKTK